MNIKPVSDLLEDYEKKEAVIKLIMELEARRDLKNICCMVMFFLFAFCGFCQNIHAEDYLPASSVSNPPVLDKNKIAAAVIYPHEARKSGVEGRVILELFIDKYGQIQHIRILYENPSGNGFGEAAVNAFSNINAEPALVNGVAVNSRLRFPISFMLR